MARRGRQDGSVALETAFAIPFLVFLIAAAAEFAFISLIDHQLGYAARAAARFGITGQAPEEAKKEDEEDDDKKTPIAWCDGASPPAENPRLLKIRQIVSDLSFGVLKKKGLCLQVLAYDGYEDIGEPEPYVDINGDGTWTAGEAFTDVNGNGVWDPDQGSYGAGGAGAVVVYTLRYETKPLIGVIPSLPPTKTIRFTARIPVRNEPF